MTEWMLYNIENEPLHERIIALFERYEELGLDNDCETVPIYTGNGEIECNKEKAYAFADWFEQAINERRSLTSDDVKAKFGCSDGIKF